MADLPEFWTAPDGTVWMEDPSPLGTFTGWEPGEDGVWTLDADEFTVTYPTAPWSQLEAADG